jgi:hypothetical protein
MSYSRRARPKIVRPFSRHQNKFGNEQPRASAVLQKLPESNATGAIRWEAGTTTASLKKSCATNHLMGGACGNEHWLA